LYQTPAIRHLEIHGTSLSVDAQLTFSPPLTKGVDYKVLRATSDVMVLGLLAGKMWRQTAGQLMLMSVDTGSGPVEMAHGTGIVVADVSANPTVATSTARITTSTTRRLSIYGTGFAIDGTELTLEPTSRAAYDVEAVYENEVVLRLREGKSWAALGSAESMPLVVTKIDTAAGEYIFQDTNGKPAPVTVALVVPDSAATSSNGDVMRCDDTCMWANDGVCDDGSQGTRGKKEENGGAWWEDDDLGGWYSDELAEDLGDEYDYGYDYDDAYGYYGDDAAMPACVKGTDCTDCGSPLKLMGGDNDATVSEPLGDWDDDEWFDDDSEEWWDDDYDFGKDWDGFEDDESGALGIISSVQPSVAFNKRHMTPEQRAAMKAGVFSWADHPALSAVAALLGALAAAWGCATMRRSDEAPKENPCCGGKFKEAQA
jgi:hypothetical protein